MADKVKMESSCVIQIQTHRFNSYFPGQVYFPELTTFGAFVTIFFVNCASLKCLFIIIIIIINLGSQSQIINN